MAIIERETAKAILIQGDSILLTNFAGEPIWGLPGGGLEPRENPAQALIRELREEIGLQLSWASPLTELYASYQPFGQFKDTVHEHMHLFAGQLMGMGREGIRKYEKGLNLMWIPVAHVMPMESPEWMVRPLEVLRYIVEVGSQMIGKWGR